jgi:hypothetical protein
MLIEKEIIEIIVQIKIIKILINNNNHNKIIKIVANFLMIQIKVEKIIKIEMLKIIILIKNKIIILIDKIIILINKIAIKIINKIIIDIHLIII